MGRGLQITFPIGNTVSIQFGTGNYCENKCDITDFSTENYLGSEIEAGARGSTTAEVAVIRKNGEYVQFDSDTVKGWVTPEELLDILFTAAILPEGEEWPK